MSDEKPKSIENRLVDSFLPLAVWVQQKALGSLFTSEAWHQIAISLVPPPDSFRRNVVEGCKVQGIYEAHATEALHSPSMRRKLRRYAQHRFQRMLRKDHGLRSGLPVMRDYLLRWRRNLEAVGEADLTRITKLTDTEAKIKRDLDVLSRNPIIIDQWLPPEEVVDPRFYAAIMREGGRQGYAYDVIILMEDFALHARALEMERLTPNSHIFTLLGFDREKLKAPETCVIEFLGKLLAMLGIKIGSVPRTEDVQLDWGKIGKVFQWAIRRELPKMILGKNYSVRARREVSLDKPVNQDTSLKDVLLNHRATEQRERFEERMVIESSLELLPSGQREACRFFLDADDKGKNPDELRCEVGEKKYETLKRNERRARKTLKYLKESGKLPT